jgi:hypothetical protein
VSNTVQKIQASTNNTFGLMATPAVDLTPTGHLPYAVQATEQPRERAEHTEADTAREHTEHDEAPLMSALVTALPEFELNSPELLYAVFDLDPDTDGTRISLNSQGNGQLYTPDQADDFADKVIVWGQTVKAMAAAARKHVEAEDTDGCGINLDTMTAAVHESMQKAVPDYYTPERAEAFAACMVAELRAPSAERRGASPLAGLSIVTALISGVQVPIACPAAWCTENHTGEDTKHLEDVAHTGAHVDAYVPHFQKGGAELFAYAYLAQDPYSKRPEERAAYIRVEDGGGEESHMTPDQADTFAGNLTVFAGRIRTLARVARATDEPATESMREAICPVWPTVCTDTTPGHYDHHNHEHKVTDKRGGLILDVGFVQLSDERGDSPAFIHIGGEDFDPSEVRAKTAELRRLLDQADAMADQVMRMQGTAVPPPAERAFSAALESIDAAFEASQDIGRTRDALRTFVDMTAAEVRA